MHVNTVFGCCPERNPNYFATKCKNFPLNSNLFFQNYFTVVHCPCKNVNKNTYCNYRRNLQDNLNYLTYKVCCVIENTADLLFEIINFDKYLYDLKAGPFFVTDKKFCCIDVLIDHNEWIDFFRGKETD